MAIEPKIFIFFLLCVVFSAFAFLWQGISNLSVLGYLGLFWGVFGFLRLSTLSITPRHSATTGALSLPAQILFGLHQKQKQYMADILTHLARPSILLCLGGAGIFLVILILNSLYPFHLDILQKLHDLQGAILNTPIHNRLDLYALMQGLTYYATLAIIFMMAYSFAVSPTHFKWAALLLLPLFIGVSAMVVYFQEPATKIVWHDIRVWRGGGFGQQAVLERLLPNSLAQSGTGLFGRHMAFGSLGAYGVYVMFIPLFSTLLINLWRTHFAALAPWVGLFTLCVLGAFDVLWLNSPLQQSITILGLALLGLSLGKAARSA